MAKLKMEATAQSPYTATNLLCVTGKKRTENTIFHLLHRKVE